MPMPLCISIAILIIAVLCLLLVKAINRDINKMADKVVNKAIDRQRPYLTAGLHAFSDTYASEDDELQIPLNSLKWITISEDIKPRTYRLQWASSILEHHYRQRLPKYVKAEPGQDSVSFAIDIAMTDKELERFTDSRKYEQLFLTICDNETGHMLGTYKIVVYYSTDLYLRNNPSFA